MERNVLVERYDGIEGCTSQERYEVPTYRQENEDNVD